MSRRKSLVVAGAIGAAILLTAGSCSEQVTGKIVMKATEDDGGCELILEQSPGYAVEVETKDCNGRVGDTVTVKTTEDVESVQIEVSR